MLSIKKTVIAAELNSIIMFLFRCNKSGFLDRHVWRNMDACERTDDRQGESHAPTARPPASRPQSTPRSGVYIYGETNATPTTTG